MTKPGKSTGPEARAVLTSGPALAADEPDEPGAVLDERIQAQIGQQLSSFYRELVNQPIPDAFVELLAKLDRAENAASLARGQPPSVPGSPCGEQQEGEK